MPAPTAWHLLHPAERRLAQLAANGRTAAEVADLVGVERRQVEAAVASARERLAGHRSPSADGQPAGRFAPG